MVCVVLAALAAGGLVFLHLFPGVFAVDIPKTLPRIDALLSDPSRYADAALLLDKAEVSLRANGLGVESDLSLLKRRRVLARLKPGVYGAAYLKAALAASERFSNLEVTAVVVVDAALMSVESRPETATTLKNYAVRLSPDSFGALKTLCFTRLGELSAPSSRLSPASFLAAADAYVGHRPEVAAELTVNAAIAAFLSDDTLLGRTIIRDRLSRLDDLSPAVLRFLAEASYDFGDPLEAASLFSRIAGDENIIRRADALYLAGMTAEARGVWSSAAAGKNAGFALYNLASLSSTSEEALSFARRLYSASPDFAPGVVLYSRLSGEAEGRAILSSAAEKTKDVCIDLEAVRIDAPRVGIARTQARLWLLMNKEPAFEAAARWAAWYFATNGLSDESKRVAHAYREVVGSAQWTDFHVALNAARAGKLEEAEKAFERAASSGDWRPVANSAVVYEARRSPGEALKRYRIALSLQPDKSAAAEIHFRIARLLKSIGRELEARRSLEYSQSLDPGNRRVRIELKK